jgi:hypothetical protein
MRPASRAQLERPNRARALPAASRVLEIQRRPPSQARLRARLFVGLEKDSLWTSRSRIQTTRAPATSTGSWKASRLDASGVRRTRQVRRRAASCPWRARALPRPPTFLEHASSSAAPSTRPRLVSRASRAASRRRYLTRCVSSAPQAPQSRRVVRLAWRTASFVRSDQRAPSARRNVPCAHQDSLGRLQASAQRAHGTPSTPSRARLCVSLVRPSCLWRTKEQSCACQRLRPAWRSAWLGLVKDQRGFPRSRARLSGTTVIAWEASRRGSTARRWNISTEAGMSPCWETRGFQVKCVVLMLPSLGSEVLSTCSTLSFTFLHRGIVEMEKVTLRQVLFRLRARTSKVKPVSVSRALSTRPARHLTECAPASAHLISRPRLSALRARMRA